MIQSDATENPNERARGGMARLSAAKMPGARMAAESRDHEVHRDGDGEAGHHRDHRQAHGDRVDDVGEELDHLRRTADHQAGGDPGAEDQPEQLRRFDARGDDAAGPLVEVVDLLVEQAREHRETDQRDREERQRVPDPPEGLDLPHDPP